MSLFDLKQEVEKPDNRVSGPNKADQFEEEKRALKAKRSREIMKLGELYLKNHRETQISESEYAELVDSIIDVECEMELLEKRRLASLGLRKCEVCGMELSIDSVFCNKCGSRQGELDSEVVKASQICPECGKKFKDGDAFCIYCGHEF